MRSVFTQRGMMAAVMGAATVATPLFKQTGMVTRNLGYYVLSSDKLWNTVRIAVMQPMRLSQTRALLIRSYDPELIKPEEQ